MPLEKSSSNAARSRNIAEMRRAGYPADQAAAASYDNQRRARKHKRKAARHARRVNRLRRS